MGWESLKIISSVVRAAGSAMGLVSRQAARLGALRRAPARVGDTPSPATRKELQRALVVLGADGRHHNWWNALLTSAEAAVARPDVFRQPASRDWLSRPASQELLIDLALAEHAGRSPDTAALKPIVDSYVDATAEDLPQAISHVRLALAWLRIWLEKSAANPALAAELTRQSGAQTMQLLQETGAQLNEKVDALLENSVGAEPLVEAHAREQLQRILRARGHFVRDTAEQLRRLWELLAPGGALVRAGDDVRSEVAYWLARVTAQPGNGVEVHEWLKELGALGASPPPELRALVLFSEGKPDEALRLAREIDTAEGRSILFFLLRQTRTAEAAIAQFASASKRCDLFTAHGWRNFATALLERGDWEAAQGVFGALSEDQYRDCLDLHFYAAVACLSPALPEERRHLLLEHGWRSLAPEIRESMEARTAAAAALAHLGQGRTLATEGGSEVLGREYTLWAHAIRLAAAHSRESAIQELLPSIRDGGDAVRLAPLLFDFRVPFPREKLQAHLDLQAVAGGLTVEEMFAQFQLLRTYGPLSQLVELLDSRFEAVASAVGRQVAAIALVEALCNVGDLERAREVFALHRAEMGEAAQRLELVLETAAGRDVSAGAVAIFKETDSLGDLTNVVSVMQRAGKWNELLPFVREQFRRVPNVLNTRIVAEALERARASPREKIDFLRHAGALLDLPADMRALLAWSHFEAGEYVQARSLNQQLLREREEPNDFGLEVNLAVALGDWDRFPALLLRAQELSESLTSSTLLVVARLAGLENPVRAVELAAQAVRKAPEDAQILVGAYHVAVTNGREDEGAGWMQKAVALSKPDGPVRQYAFRELLEFMEQNRADSADKNARLRRAEVPIHFAPWLFNVTLAELLIGRARRNRAEPDARQRLPIPLWLGARPTADLHASGRLMFDVTSLYMLHETGLLATALDEFEHVFVAADVFGQLLEERQKALFHQPSRIQEAKTMLAMVEAGRLRRAPSAAPHIQLDKELGAETSGMIRGAHRDQGWYVCARPLFRLQSYMEEVADLGEFAASVRSPAHVTSWLVQTALLTPAAARECLRKLGIEEAAPVLAEPPPAALYLDSPLVQGLRHAALLPVMLTASVPLFVEESLISEWRQLAQLDSQTQETAGAVEEICRVLHRRLVEGRISILPRHTARSRKLDSSLDEVFAAPGVVEVVVIDDRMLGKLQTISGESGATASMATTLDVVRYLASTGAINDERRGEILHDLRQRCVYSVPIDSSELLTLIRAGISGPVFAETAQLKGLRQYLPRLAAAEALCTPEDLVFLHRLWTTGYETLRELWRDDSLDLDAIRAASTWLLENLLPCLDCAASEVAPATDARIALEAERAAHLSLAGLSYGKRREAYAAWFEEEYLEALTPGARPVFDKLVGVLQALIRTYAAKEDA